MSTPKRERARVGKRRRAREMAMQMLYQHEMGSSTLPEIFAAFEPGSYLADSDDEKRPKVKPEAPSAELEESFDYARKLVEGTLEHGDEIDPLIRRHAENWRLERMPTIDRNILRLALYEMLYHESVPKVVIVDEAIELAKKFGSEHSGRFVNGLLDGFLKSEITTASPASSTP